MYQEKDLILKYFKFLPLVITGLSLELVIINFNSLFSSTIILSTENSTSVFSLLVEILVNGIQRLYKQGLLKNYETKTEEVQGIKGKLLLTQSLKNAKFAQGYTTCETDELSYQHLVHDIFAATIERLLLSEDTVMLHKKELKKLQHYFPQKAKFHLQKYHFQQVKIPNYLSLYHLLLNICELLYENTFINEKSGRFRFYDFQKDENKVLKDY